MIKCKYFLENDQNFQKFGSKLIKINDKRMIDLNIGKDMGAYGIVLNA